MSSRTERSNRRRKINLVLDLNFLPPSVEGGPSANPPIHDVDCSDDDVIECSPRAYHEARINAINARRRRRRVEADSVAEGQTAAVANQIAATNDDNIIWIKLPEPEPEPEPEPVPPPVFNCPICMAPLEEEMTTRCGHIFCKKCIRTAIHRQAKCPTCRKKVTMRELIRVFLPSAN